jgi:hypothetical protein
MFLFSLRWRCACVLQGYWCFSYAVLSSIYNSLRITRQKIIEMHKGISCESIKRTTVTSFSSKSNCTMENIKPNRSQISNRPGPSKDKYKKHFQPKRQYNVPYVTDSLIIPRVKKVNNLTLFFSLIFHYCESLG